MSIVNVVVAEDDAAIRELLVHHFQNEGCTVAAVADGNSALRAARTFGDVLLLDVGLPAIDGFEVTRILRREKRHIPILMLTARTDEVDRIVGLELGVDDYVCKPFSPREVVARVKAILRRGGDTMRDRAPVRRFGRIEIDEAGREVRIDGVDAGFKPREVALLFVLANNPGIALSRRTLLEKVWGYDFEGDERTVDVHIRRIRLRLAKYAPVPEVIGTVRGFGYKFTGG